MLRHIDTIAGTNSMLLNYRAFGACADNAAGGLMAYSNCQIITVNRDSIFTNGESPSGVEREQPCTPVATIKTGSGPCWDR